MIKSQLVLLFVPESVSRVAPQISPTSVIVHVDNWCCRFRYMAVVVNQWFSIIIIAVLALFVMSAIRLLN